jgi:predicted TIM-barrel fold metal-dependent hydrolase
MLMEALGFVCLGGLMPSIEPTPCELSPGANVVIVSGDSHVGLPVEQYAEYMDPAFRPALEVCYEDERRFADFLKSFKWFTPEEVELIDRRGELKAGLNFQAVRDPQARLAAAEREGVAAEILYPLSGVEHAYAPCFSGANRPFAAETRAAGSRAYNRWLAEFCSYAPDRLIGAAAIVEWPDPAGAAAQVRQARAMGLRAVFPPQVPGLPDGGPPLSDREWDPFWAACAELEMPVVFHVGFGRPQGQTQAALERALSELRKGSPDGKPDPADAIFRQDWSARTPLWNTAGTGVFDRHPALRIAFSEVRADWVPATLRVLDRMHAEGKTASARRPSEYWASNCAVVATAIRRHELEMRHEIGLDNLLFGTDMPHTEGTWPNTHEWLRATFFGVPEHEARKILGENAIEFFGLDAKVLREVAARVGVPFSDATTNQPVDPDLLAHFDRRSGYRKAPEVIDEAELTRLINQDLAARRGPAGSASGG